MTRLQERVLDFGKEYKKTFRSLDALEYGNDKFETLEGALELFERAKEKVEGSNTKESEKAFLYLYKVIYKMAVKYFWVFLGPNTSSQQERIAQGDDIEYISLCTDALYKALKSFDPTKAKSVQELKSGFQYWFRGYIRAETQKYNNEKNSHGLSTSNETIVVTSPDGYDEDAQNNSWDSLGLYTEDDTVNNYREIWKDLIEDDMLKHKKHPWKKILSEILKGTSVEKIAEKFGISKNTIREKFFSTRHNRENGSNGALADLLEKYELTMDDFADFMKKDMGYIVNSLEK